MPWRRRRYDSGMRRQVCQGMLFGLVALTLLGIGCKRGKAPDANDDASEAAALRIVSLSPAISRTLVDLRLDDAIVGRTPWCASIDQAVPVVGDLYNLDLETMVRLDPTHVLVQPAADGIDPALQRLVDDKGWTLATWSLDSIDEVETLVREMPGVLFADDRTSRADAAARAAEIINELAAALSPQGADVFAGPTLMVMDYEPLLAFGPESYLHDMLLSLGGRNANERGAYRNLTLEDVVRLDPEAIIIVKEHAPADTDPLELLGALADTDIAAIRDGRVAVLSHPDAVLPSTGLIEVAGALREILVSFAATEP